MSASPSLAAWAQLRALLGGPSSPALAAAPAPLDQVAQAARLGGVVRLALAADPALAPHLSEDAQQRAFVALSLEAALERLAATLRAPGLALARPGGCALLKGSATAALVYPDPLARERRDLDLLVAPADFPRVAAALAAAGWTPAESRAWWATARRRHEQAFRLTVGRATVECDLHRRLSAFTAWPIDHQALLRRAITPPGALLPVSSPEDTLLHTALHAVTAGFSVPLRAWVDVARLAARRDLDWPVIVTRARAWRLAVPLWAALQVATRWLSAPVPPDVTRDLAPSPATALALRRLLSGDGATPLGHPRAASAARLLAAGGPATRARLVLERLTHR